MTTPNQPRYLAVSDAELESLYDETYLSKMCTLPHAHIGRSTIIRLMCEVRDRTAAAERRKVLKLLNLPSDYLRLHGISEDTHAR